MNYLDHDFRPRSPQLLTAVVEGLTDGVVLATPTGALLYANTQARSLFQEMTPTLPDQMPDAIWSVCQVLIAGASAFPDQTVVLEDQVQLGDRPHPIRMRVRWLPSWHRAETDYILVTLEDHQQGKEQRAIVESQRLGLTPRETEVWQLRCAQYTYAEISQQLYIGLNTVKKHLKNIYTKQQNAQSVAGSGDRETLASRSLHRSGD